MILFSLFSGFGVQLVLFSSVVALFIAAYLFRAKRFFERYGVKHDTGIPPLGTFAYRFFKNESWMKILRRIYYRFPNETFVGLCEIGGEPSFLIRDPELVQQIWIKDFNCFVNRFYQVHQETDPLIGHQLTNLKTNEWRRVRNSLTPMFTSQKFRQFIVPSMIETKQNLVDFIKEKMSGEETISIDMFEVITRSVIDSFAATAFGIKTDSVRGNDDGLYDFGQSYVEHYDSKKPFEYYSIYTFPRLMKRLFDRAFVKESDNTYFKDFLSHVADIRTKNKIQRNDYLQLFERAIGHELNKDNVDKIAECNNLEAISQNFEFLESVITENNVLITFLSCQLAANDDIQRRLFDECTRIESELDGDALTLETLTKLKYMDQVIAEGLRMCPIATELHRRAIKRYTLRTSDGIDVPVKPGDTVWVPIYTMHMDEKYFPAPEVFDPERFSDDNKKNIVKGAYAPFGLGPRDCIGCRYTTIETKITLFALCTNFVFESDTDANSIHQIKLRRRN